MKRTTIYHFTLLIGLICLFSTANATSIPDLLARNAQETEAVKVPSHPFVQKLSFGFGNSELKLAKAGLLKNSIIERVDFYYSSYRENDHWKQQGLNKQRLEALKEILPQAYGNDLTEWHMFVQIEEDKDRAKVLFHGFLVYFRPTPTKTTTTSEIAFLRDLLTYSHTPAEGVLTDVLYGPEEVTEETVSHRELARTYYPCHKSGAYTEVIPEFPGGCNALEEFVKNAYKNVKLSKKKSSGYFQCKLNAQGEAYDFRFRHYLGLKRSVGATSEIKEMPDWNMPDGAGDSSYTLKVGFSLVRLRRKVKFRLNYVMIKKAAQIVEKRVEVVVAAAVVPTLSFADETISNFFKRNKDIRNAAVICDVTGSMSPYTGQVLLWHKLNFASHKDQLQYFCFFNDGNNKADRKKRIGEVGGLYFARPSSYLEVERLAFKAMRAGYGGDAPENNYEAALKTLEKYPTCKELIMIADNWATPRDISLIEQIDQPIKVVLCGVAEGYLNTAYLDAVRENGGSIHTIESDISTLSDMNEGEVVSIEGIDYRLVKGSFILVGPTPK